MREEFRNIPPLKRQIIKALWRDKRKNRAELIEELNVKRTTLYDNLAKGQNSLLKRGIVDKMNRNIGTGRPQTLWFLTDDFIIEMETDLREKMNNPNI